MIPVRRAIVSVSDKAGVADFASFLQKECGTELLSTGGTCKLLQEKQIPVTEVSDYTGFPEMMSGRLKTLHPKIHGGILARRGTDDEALASQGIGFIDLIVVNLYPFAATIAKPNCTLEDAIENIDIGGPTMLRAAAKNWEHVAVICVPSFYEKVKADLEKNFASSGKYTISRETRFQLARATFEATSQYDGMIANYLGALPPLSAADSGAGGNDSADEKKAEKQQFSEFFYNSLKKKQDLRYGENPHQSAALYSEEGFAKPSVATAEQLQGKELSYNNIADADGALDCCLAFDPKVPCCVIVKHANPCGVAVSENSLVEAYEKAFQTDPTSAFGGIIAVNQELNLETAEKIVKNQFVEVILAPTVAPEASAVVATKKNVRLLAYAGTTSKPTTTTGTSVKEELEYKKIRGGLLVQTRDEEPQDITLKVVTEKQPSEKDMEDLKFAWKVCQFVKSNAIVYAKDGMTYGVGAGQMSRVFSSKIAVEKAAEAKLELQGAAMASDAFFPFRDGIDTAAKSGVGCIIQPGGSIRDKEVIDAANEHGIAMVFTGCRHFKH
ncbi:unnamed protein product [Amoebophrya sp. A120]|nr:unnamed protein product [Amoebophrya sp. A120]|eukprot:GSA120T00001576001.1